MQGVPVLETPRLLLRGPRLGDFPEYSAMWADPVVTKYITHRPETEEEAWRRLLRTAGLWALLGYGFWILEEKATGRLLGQAGFMEAMRPILPELRGLPEVGWSLIPDAHGNGIATEAVTAALKWGDVRFRDVRIFCMVDVDNNASIRLAERLGFKETARMHYHDALVIMFQREPGGR